MGKSGVIVTLAGGPDTVGSSTTTDNSGNWSLSVGNGAYAITPILAGVSSTPANRSVTVNNANSPGNNFTAATRSESVSFGANVKVSRGITAN